MFRVFAFVFAIAGLALAFSGSQANAQGKFNKKVKIGDQAPAYNNLPGVDGKNHSLSDLAGKEIVVLIVTCNHCPVSVAYEDRIIEFNKKFAGSDGKVALVAINVNNLEADKLPKMKERAAEKGFTFPYLYDESQKIGREYGASVTPEFFVLNKDRKIVYTGAMDDNNDSSKVKNRYLESAVQSALKGEVPTTVETAGRGCSVKYEKAKNK